MTVVVNQVKESSSRITLTNAAKEHLMAYLKKEKNCKGVRFSVKKTGCSGLSYVVDYVEILNEQDIALPFVDPYKIYVDKGSYPFLKGMQVDFIQQGLNSKLQFSNPNQTGQCGCGESFTVTEMEEIDQVDAKDN